VTRLVAVVVNNIDVSPNLDTGYDQLQLVLNFSRRALTANQTTVSS